VSNLAFVSKVVERLVSEQITEYLQEHNMMPRLQSAYRHNHSTKTALLWVISDLLAAIDHQQVSLLGLLNLSAAFDCIDHDILIGGSRRLLASEEQPSWITLFLVDRTQQVSFGGRLSSISRLICGIPQGSVLGPLLFILHTAEILYLVAAHSLSPTTLRYKVAMHRRLSISSLSVRASDWMDEQKKS